MLKSPTIEEDSTRQATLARSFVRVCAEQFSGDGLHIEFCPIYHRLSLDMVAIGYAMMRRACPAVATALDALLERGTGVCKSLCNAAGELPLLGDSDSGKVLDFGQDARRFGAYAWLLYGGDGGAAEGRRGATVGEALFGAVLSGISGKSEDSIGSPEYGPAAVPGRSRVVEVPPYIVLEGAGQKVVVRCGRLGLAGRGGHDHDDALSFWYSVGEQDVMVDVGCPPYTRDLRERFHAIRSSSHNVVTGADVSGSMDRSGQWVCRCEVGRRDERRSSKTTRAAGLDASWCRRAVLVAVRNPELTCEHSTWIRPATSRSSTGCHCHPKEPSMSISTYILGSRRRTSRLMEHARWCRGTNGG